VPRWPGSRKAASWDWKELLEKQCRRPSRLYVLLAGAGERCLLTEPHHFPPAFGSVWGGVVPASGLRGQVLMHRRARRGPGLYGFLSGSICG
jgi:hypothetical protein